MAALPPGRPQCTHSNRDRDQEIAYTVGSAPKAPHLAHSDLRSLCRYPACEFDSYTRDTEAEQSRLEKRVSHGFCAGPANNYCRHHGGLVLVAESQKVDLVSAALLPHQPLAQSPYLPGIHGHKTTRGLHASESDFIIHQTSTPVDTKVRSAGT